MMGDMALEDISSRAAALGIDLSQVDWDSIRLPPNEDFGIISDDEDIKNQDALEFDDELSNIIVVDNLPIVPKEKFEKLEGVIRKIYGQIGVIKENGLWMPIDPNTQKTLGYCFIEYNLPQEAEVAREKTNNYKLDRSHIFAVNMFDDIEKFMKVPDEWAPPESKPYEPGSRSLVRPPPINLLTVFPEIQEGLLKKFKLTTTISRSNMHLFDRNRVIKKYEKKIVQIDKIKLEKQRLENKARFIKCVNIRDIIIFPMETEKLVLQLEHMGFTPLPMKNMNEDCFHSSDIAFKIKQYEYLLSLSIDTFTFEKLHEIYSKIEALTGLLEDYSNASPQDLWKKDIDNLETILNDQDKADSEAEEARKKIQYCAMGNASSPEPTETSDSIGIGRGAPKKAAAPKGKGKAIAEIIEEEDDEILVFKEEISDDDVDDDDDSEFDD